MLITYHKKRAEAAIEHYRSVSIDVDADQDIEVLLIGFPIPVGRIDVDDTKGLTLELLYKQSSKSVRQCGSSGTFLNDKNCFLSKWDEQMVLKHPSSPL